MFKFRAGQWLATPELARLLRDWTRSSSGLTRKARQKDPRHSPRALEVVRGLASCVAPLE